MHRRCPDTTHQALGLGQYQIDERQDHHQTMTDQTLSDRIGGKWLGGSDHLLMTYCTNTNMELFKDTNMDISHIEIWNRSDTE